MTSSDILMPQIDEQCDKLGKSVNIVRSDKPGKSNLKNKSSYGATAVLSEARLKLHNDEPIEEDTLSALHNSLR